MIDNKLVSYAIALFQIKWGNKGDMQMFKKGLYRSTVWSMIQGANYRNMKTAPECLQESGLFRNDAENAHDSTHTYI